jgi:dTDP-4-dehydrorhamnose reductase
MKIVVYGYKGWIAGQLMKNLPDSVPGLSRINNSIDVKKELIKNNATHVILATCRRQDKIIQDVDYLELPGKIGENIRDNLFGPACVASICYELDIHLTYISDGAIYNSNNNRIWCESDLPNGCDSNYYQCIRYTDMLLSSYANTLVLRLSFPVTNELNDPQNNYKKLLGYNLILNKPISVTVLPCFNRIIKYLIESKVVGTFNCVNPNIITQFEMRQMIECTTNIDINIVSSEELSNYVISERPSPILSCSKLMKYLNIKIPDVKTALKNMIKGEDMTIFVESIEVRKAKETAVRKAREAKEAKEIEIREAKKLAKKVEVRKAKKLAKETAVRKAREAKEKAVRKAREAKETKEKAAKEAAKETIVRKKVSIILKNQN